MNCTYLLTYLLFLFTDLHFYLLTKLLNCLVNSEIESFKVTPPDASQEIISEISRPIFERKYETVKNQNIDKSVSNQNLIKSLVIKVIYFLASNTVKQIKKP